MLMCTVSLGAISLSFTHIRAQLLCAPQHIADENSGAMVNVFFMSFCFLWEPLKTPNAALCSLVKMLIYFREPLKTPNATLCSLGKMLIYFSKLRFCLSRKP